MSQENLSNSTISPKGSKDVLIKLHKTGKAATQRKVLQHTRYWRAYLLEGSRSAFSLLTSTRIPMNPFSLSVCTKNTATVNCTAKGWVFKHPEMGAFTSLGCYTPTASYLADSFPYQNIKLLAKHWQSIGNSSCLLILFVYLILKKFVENIYNSNTWVYIHQ